MKALPPKRPLLASVFLLFMASGSLADPMTLAFRASDDSTVTQASPDTNQPNINIRYNDRYAYLRFSVRGLVGQPVKSIRLRLKESAGGKAGATNFDVRATTSPWSETGVTWNTRPQLSNTVLGSYRGGQMAENQVLEVPLSSGFVTGDGDYAIALIPVAAGNDNEFVPHDVPNPEDAHPRLLVELSAGSADTTVKNFPSNAVVNVKNLGVAGNGTTDDTARIQAIVKEYGQTDNIGKTPRTLYFPNGTYLLSDKIDWISKVNFQGQSTNGTIFKLKDGAAGYGNAGSPKYVIGLGALQSDNYGIGFVTGLYNLSVDVGSGNPGSVGVQFYADNQGGMRDVVIKSSDPNGAGYAGIQERSGSGPAIIKNVNVYGFRYGIKFGGGTAHENIGLYNQSVAGVDNRASENVGTGVGGPIFTVRNLRSVNSVPVFDTDRFEASVNLVDLIVGGGSGANPAIRCFGAIFARNVRSYGYGGILQDTRNNRVVSGAALAEYASETYGLFATGTPRSLNLPVEDYAPVNYPDPGTWASVTSYGANPEDYSGDDSDAIQAAIDSGARVVYFPPATTVVGYRNYLITKTIKVRGNVEYIIGGWQGLKCDTSSFNSATPIFSIENTTAPRVVIEQFSCTFDPPNGCTAQFDHVSNKPLVLRNIVAGYRPLFYKGNSGSGTAFIEDVVGRGLLMVNPQQKIYARHFNSEQNTDYSPVEVRGGQYWQLQSKTEQIGNRSVVRVLSGAKAEIIGTWNLTVTGDKGPSAGTPAFEVIDGSLSVSANIPSFGNESPNYMNYTVAVREKRGGTTRELPMLNVRAGGYYQNRPVGPGRNMALFSTRGN
jgi:hypothetical protein